MGVALLTGKTGAAPAADGAEPMAYEKEAVTTEGGLEATVEVSCAVAHCGQAWVHLPRARRCSRLVAMLQQGTCNAPIAGNAPRRDALPACNVPSVCDRAATHSLQDEAAEANAVAPQMFKSLVGRGHSEFSSNRQQARRDWGWRRRGASLGQEGAAQCRSCALLDSRIA